MSCLLAVMFSSSAAADPASFGPTQTTPDAPARSEPAPPYNRPLPPVWDLDGLYLWLGPTGAASHVAAAWDSTFGGDATVLRVREHELVGAVGGSLGAAKWTERGGGRIWLDGVAGTPIGSRMAGVTAGPILELTQLHHPRIGGSIGAWAFVGVTPYVRVGVVQDLGAFAELGVHVALPVVRWRR